MSIQPSDSKMPVINPHMKFKERPIGVVSSPAVYQYSLQNELEIANNYYKEFLESVNKHKKSRLAQKYPNLSKNISDVLKFITGLVGVYCIVRYRHSVPLLKNLCKKPKQAPPKFLEDLSKIWQSIVKK